MHLVIKNGALKEQLQLYCTSEIFKNLAVIAGAIIVHFLCQQFVKLG